MIRSLSLALLLLAACSTAAEPAGDAGLPDSGTAPADAGIGTFGDALEIDCAAPVIPSGGFAFTVHPRDADAGTPLAMKTVACKCFGGVDGGLGYLEVAFANASATLTVTGTRPSGRIEVGRYTSVAPGEVEVRGRVSSPGQFLYEAAPRDKGSETLLLVEKSDAQGLVGSFALFELRVLEPANVNQPVEVTPPIRAACKYK